MNGKYVCPICGKEWETTSELAKCVMNCDKEETLKKKEEDKSRRTKELSQLEEEIQALYETLKLNVAKYNEGVKGYQKDYGFNATFPMADLSFSLKKNMNSKFATKDKSVLKSSRTTRDMLDDLFTYYWGI